MVVSRTERTPFESLLNTDFFLSFGKVLLNIQNTYKEMGESKIFLNRTSKGLPHFFNFNSKYCHVDTFLSFSLLAADGKVLSSR